MKNIRSVTLNIFFPLVFYFSLAFGLTYPLVFNLNSGPLRWEADTSFWLWNLWWVNKSIGELNILPFYTEYILHPTGIDLSYHPFSFYNTLLGIPLSHIFGLIPAYNLLIITSFFFAGCGAFLLARNEGISIKASLASGLIYGFSPYHFGEFGRLDSTSIQWIPFATLFMLRLYRDGKLWNAVMSGIFLALVALCSWYYMVFIVILFFCILLYILFCDSKIFRWRLFIVNSLALFGIFFVLVFPFIYPVIKAIIVKSGAVSTGPSYLRADLLGFMKGVPGQSFEFIIWPVVFGYIASAFGFYASLKVRWRNSGLWIFLAVLFFILALGPRLIIAGKMVPFIRLPERIFYYLPVLSSIRAPYRFIVMSSLAISVLAGYGIDNVLKGITSRFKKPVPLLSTVFLFVLLVAEIWIIPIPVQAVTAPEFYRRLSKENGDFAILEIPRSIGTWSSAMFYQTFHGKRIVGGYTGYPNPEFKFIDSSPVLSALSKMEISQLNTGRQDIAEGITSILQDMKIRYVIVRLDYWYCLKIKTELYDQKSDPAQSPFLPASLRRHRFGSQDTVPDDLLQRFLSSREGCEFKEVFGEPVFVDKKMVVYNSITL